MSEPMIDGRGELSLGQAKEITDGWRFDSDSKPLVAERLWKEIDDLREVLRLMTVAKEETFHVPALHKEIMRLKMAMRMVCQEDAFYTTYDEKTGKHDPKNPKLCLLMNDVWAWATADGEQVEWDQVPEVFAIWEKDGWDGLLVWACRKRNAKPQKPMFDKLKPDIQAKLAGLPRFGDVEVPVGDGKVACFDDGWDSEERKAECPAKPAPSRIRRALNAVYALWDRFFSLDVGSA